MTERLVTKEQETLPATFNEVSSMAKAFVQSGYFSDTKQLAQAIVKIQAGKELGLPPVYSMQNINLIRDRLTSSANTMAMLVKKSGRYNYRIKEHTDQACTITFYELDGEKWLDVGASSFTMEDAKRANLVKPDSGWMKYPRAMLFSRAISQGARMYAPDAIGGIYTDEEIRSIPSRPEEEIRVIPPKPENTSSTRVDITTGGITEPIAEPEPSLEHTEPQIEVVKIKNSGIAPTEIKQPAKPKRDPATIKTIEQLARALKEDFGLTYKEQYAELNIKSWNELAISLTEAYQQIAGGRR